MPSSKRCWQKSWYSLVKTDLLQFVNEDQYRQLCAACDQVLLSQRAGDTTVAIPWLHVIRPHPMFLPQYEQVFDGGPGAGGESLRRLRNLASRLRSLAAAVVHQGPWWSVSAPLSDGADVIFVSHLLNWEQAGSDHDFYFGSLPTSLAARGYKVAVVLIDYTGFNPDKLASRWAKSGVPRVILHHALDSAAELQLIARGRREARRLRDEAEECNDPFYRLVLTRAAIEARGGAQLHALRLGEQLHALVGVLKPSTLITTYEGHAWERIVYARARDAQPGIRCIGYQHAGLINMQHAAVRRLSARYEPDTIACAGTMARDALRRNPALRGIDVDVIGSVRSLAPSAIQEAGQREACLVLPEGNLQECRLLFGLSLACARQDSSLQFIWRLHPNMRYDDLVQQHPEFAEPPANIELSTTSLSADIARSAWTLYRGSTAAIQAAAGGAFPVYLGLAGEIPVDTLIELNGLRKQVNSADDYLALMHTSADIERGIELQQIQAYCAQIFNPLDADRLASLLMPAQQKLAATSALR